MKNYFFLLLILLLTSCKSKIIETTSLDYYFTFGNIDFIPSTKWTKVDNNIATFSLGFVKGDCCGSVPNPEVMKSKIIGDTIFYTSGKNYIVDCERRFGTCGANPKFVINIKKYPNYQKLKWKLVNEREFYNLR
jgi:hypothetical protein